MPIDPKEFFNLLSDLGIKFFSGVPDSLLKEFCLCLDENIDNNHHVICANEGNAIALAAGHYLSTGQLPLVYMQNSGFGNAINPLLSLCDASIYSIPMVLTIGWRGEPGVKDEPQHEKQGKIQIDLLKTIGMKYSIVSKDDENYKVKVNEIISYAKKNDEPAALVIKKGAFAKFSDQEYPTTTSDSNLKRESALKIIMSEIGEDSIIVSTTGKTSREIFEIRTRNNENHSGDFLTVGSMGHCSSIALGMALSRPEKNIFCIDGDGSMLMHFGTVATIASLKPKNFKYILLNNQVHESVGGQSTAAKNLNMVKIIKSMDSFQTLFANNSDELKSTIKEFCNYKTLSFLEVKIVAGSRHDLGRPTISPIENKQSLMIKLNGKK